MAAQRTIRRGLPRVAGGEPWPIVSDSAADPAVAVAVHADPPSQPVASGVKIRQGLPRVTGGTPWPPLGASAPPAIAADAPKVPEAAAPAVLEASTAEPAPDLQPAPAPAPEPQPAPEPVVAVQGAPTPGGGLGDLTVKQWAGASLIGGAALLAVLGLVIAAVRSLVALPFMQSFIAAYPGEYDLPAGAPSGFPAWLGWQHFFNVFLIVLIIRSGLQVRHERRPPAYWSPKTNPGRKISISLWFHQSLDILWLVNGLVFIVLLFATGQWMRIVPTSWEVFPNALSAGLQYASLDWPTDNGWVNYNSLQQLAYFVTVFIAAPLAAVTGVRMSGVWPQHAKKLSRVYRVEVARAIHFPVMLYFVVFIVVHVALVFATGALRNLNHMYAGTDEVNWAGFWIFAASIAVIAAAWIAARPTILASIARLFGSVSAR